MTTLLTVALLLAVTWPGPSAAADAYDAVLNSPHNFFARSEFPVGRRVCTGCHADEPAPMTPDAAPPAENEIAPAGDALPPPLWQREAAAYTVSAVRSTDASNACLGCHDGVLGGEIHQTVARGAKSFDHPNNVVYPRRANGQFVPERPTVNVYRYWSIPDLRDGALVLPTGPTSTRLTLPAADQTSSGARLVRTSQGMVQCDSCHDPHDNASAPFLRAPAQDLCFICHDR
ncbi:MAG: cytochrome c3 family protein [Nitrospirota bacterium]